jgi:hypothetical protein
MTIAKTNKPLVLLLAFFMALPLTAGAQTPWVKAKERAEANKEKWEERQAERQAALEERDEKRQELFCARFTETMERLSSRMEDRSANVKDRVAKRSERRSDRRENRDAWLSSKRDTQDDRHEALYARLGAVADTDAEKAALAEFKTSADAALATRRSAVDKAIADFRTAVDQLVVGKKDAAADAYEEFKTALDRAMSEAQADCSAGTDPATVRAEFSTAMKAAREDLRNDRVATAKLGDDIKALAETKRQAIQAAVGTYRVTMEEARAKLKTVLGAE